MILKKIILENIRSYENQEIIFPTGSVILSGDIGSGKTSILLAIEFALFGLQPGQKGSALLRNGKDECKVILELEIDEKKVVIERGMKKAKSVNQSSAFIEISGIREEMSITELKNKVLELLNYPKEFAKKTNLLYRFTVYTPQEEMKQIILESSETRLDTLRHIFGIDKYKRIRENTDAFTIKLREQIRNYEGQIKDLPDSIKKLDANCQHINFLEENLKIISKELAIRKDAKLSIEKEARETEVKIKEKEKYEQEADKTRIMLLGKNELLSSIENQKSQIIGQLEEIKKLSFDSREMEILEQEIKKNESLHEQKNRSYFDILSKINALNLKISDSLKSKSQISSLKLCPTCFQDVAEDYKSNVLRKFDDDVFTSKKQVALLTEEKESLIKELDLVKSQLISSKKALDEKRLIKIKLENAREKESKLLDLEKQKLSAEKDILILEKQIETLKESQSLLKKYDLIHEQKKKDLQIAVQNERQKELELASTAKEKEITLRLVEDIKKNISDKESIKEKLIKFMEIEDFLSSSFLEMISFTERNIMLKLREEFSKLFNEWFNILVPETFSVRLDEDFTPVIEQQDFSLDYSFLSGGERTAVALAYRLALNQVINSLLSKIKTRDIVILDEPTDGFSEQQLDKMRDVLSQLKVEQLIIVSHESKIESFVESIIKFKKEQGITKVMS